MHSSLVFASSFLAIFQSWVSAMAISNLPRDFRVGTPGIVHYDGNVTKRDDVPDRCWVSTIGKWIYWYVPFYAGDENYAYQITKDGGGKRSPKGVFEAKWEGYTTAIPDRGPMQATLDAYSRFSLPNCDAAPQACSHQTATTITTSRESLSASSIKTAIAMASLASGEIPWNIALAKAICPREFQAQGVVSALREANEASDVMEH
ncbi:hypothetical protein NM208_g6388 [Fusarium decemcellulare]|uniref:Uncharacterized protein n=1 Tax=Fusarium decemcellulare TaxID=57161 RepID=A0ACC1SDI0_9HYPO|nr:hypothetical protein NM208_g6388 [Fusarium decemcellulare]